MSTESSGLNKKNKLYIVSELFYPETISTGYILTEIAKHISDYREVVVIAGPEFYEKTKNSTYPPLNNIEIIRGKYPSFNKNNFLSRVYGNIAISLVMLRLMLKNISKNTEVLMVTNPATLFVLTSIFVKRKSWKISLIVHDVFPENLVAGGVFKSKKSLIFNVLSKIFKKAYLKMNTLIVLGRDMKELFEKKAKNGPNIVIIENWADTKGIIKHDFIKTKTNFLFAGNIGRLQGLQVLLEVIKQTQNFDYGFTFIGTGAFEENLIAYVKEHNLNNVKKHGWLPREEQDGFLSKATVGLVSLQEGMFGLGVPSKTYNLLAAGKPIFYVGDFNSEIHKLIEENNVGWFAEAGNLKSIQKVLISIVNSDESILRKKGENARLLAENKYSKSLILNKFETIFKETGS